MQSDNLLKTALLDFASVTVSFIVHSTENEEKLVQMVSQCMLLPEEEVTREELAAHYGNKLVLISAHVTGDAAFEIASNILSGLENNSKKTLIEELEKHLDEHDALYLRIDRQELPERIVLGDEESIRIKFKPKNRRRDRKSMILAYRELIEK